MKSYLITDPRYYYDLDSFSRYLYKIYQKHHVDFASFRDKNKEDKEDIEVFAKRFLEISQEFVTEKVLLHHDIDLANRLGFDGVHLSSLQFSYIFRAKSASLYTVVSTHTLKEIEEVQRLGADALTISPIFASPHKGVPKGISFLKEAVVLAKGVNLFALGGIVSKKQVEMCQKSGAFGFASIRYFI